MTDAFSRRPSAHRLRHERLDVDFFPLVFAVIADHSEIVAENRLTFVHLLGDLVGNDRFKIDGEDDRRFLCKVGAQIAHERLGRRAVSKRGERAAFRVDSP